MIEVTANKTMFGKRDKSHPFAATLQGYDYCKYDLAFGSSVSDAKANALTALEDSYVAARAPLVIRIANDGSVFTARWVGKDRMEYYITRNGQSNCVCMGACNQSLQSYMDYVVGDYDNCTMEVSAWKP